MVCNVHASLSQSIYFYLYLSKVCTGYYCCWCINMNISKQVYIGLKWLYCDFNRCQQISTVEIKNGKSETKSYDTKQKKKKKEERREKKGKKERFQMHLMSAIECNRNAVSVCVNFILAYICIYRRKCTQSHVHTTGITNTLYVYCTCTTECMHWMHNLKKKKKKTQTRLLWNEVVTIWVMRNAHYIHT